MFNLKRNIILATLLIGAVGFLLLNKPVGQTQQQSVELPDEVIVTLTDEGFNPKEVVIHEGSAVRFTNESSTDSASVNSDDFPDNRKYPELNLGLFQKGSTLVHIFSKAGKYTYHNQFHPEHTGSIEVQ